MNDGATLSRAVTVAENEFEVFDLLDRSGKQ